MSISASFVHGAPAINNFAVTKGTRPSPAPSPERMPKSSADAGTRPAFAILSLRLEVGFANPIGQAAKLQSKTNSTDRFFKLRRVATAGVVALPASLAAAVDRVRHAASA
jgi:hypothetical protein